VDVVDDRDRDSGGAGLGHETRFDPDPRSTEPVVEFRQSIGFRHANLVHGGATEELGPPEFGLGPPFDQHTRAMWAGDKNLSSTPSDQRRRGGNPTAGGIVRASRAPSLWVLLQSGRSTRISFGTRAARRRPCASPSSSYEGKNAATFPDTTAAMPPISRAIASCISLPRFTKRVVTLGETRSNRFSRGNGDAYVRSTRRRAAIPRRSA